MYILLEKNNKIEGRGKQLKGNLTCKGLLWEWEIDYFKQNILFPKFTQLALLAVKNNSFKNFLELKKLHYKMLIYFSNNIIRQNLCL